MGDEKRLHPYLLGNFAPIESSLGLTPCDFEGTIPDELAGGEYVRNGGNPLTNDDAHRDAHWFDGDGMLSGVLFKRASNNTIQPEFVNQYLLTDLYCYSKQTSRSLRVPVLPSIATLVNPLRSFLAVFATILRTIFLVIISRFPGRWTIKKISVANTAVVFHDGRALATCESGPPLRFQLPGLETVGWWDGRKADNEPDTGETRSGFGGDGMLAFMHEWTTAHPKVDPVTKEFIAFHSTFAQPFVRYSIVRSAEQNTNEKLGLGPSRFNEAVPGVDSPKMMHDFGVSREHTIILDLPLTLDPMNGIKGLPNLCYDTTRKSRFGVFPRYAPQAVQWFETNPCLIFHTANCWDTIDDLKTTNGVISQNTVHMLACRLTSASVVFASGNLPVPTFAPVPPEYSEEDQCRLYYYNFPLQTTQQRDEPTHIKHQWALAAIPFEFPSVAPSKEMVEARYIYGCSSSESFTVALGKASKIDFLVKMDARELIDRGLRKPPQAVKGCVDERTIKQILHSTDAEDPIKVFALPKGYHAQEPRFVPRRDDSKGALREDDGWLLTYVFDESQLDAQGRCLPHAKSEMWVIDARNMKDVVAKIKLPQRVPYGLHGCWFSEEDIKGQRPNTGMRSLDDVEARESGVVASIRDGLERWIG